MQEMENEMKHFIFLFVRIRICKEAKIKGKENAQRTNPQKFEWMSTRKLEKVPKCQLTMYWHLKPPKSTFRGRWSRDRAYSKFWTCMFESHSFLNTRQVLLEFPSVSSEGHLAHSHYVIAWRRTCGARRTLFGRRHRLIDNLDFCVHTVYISYNNCRGFEVKV